MPPRQPKVRDDLEFFEQEFDGDTVVVVRDPVRGTYYRYNVLQAEMLRSLDGTITIDEMTAQLGERYEVEVPREAAERFVAHAKKQLLLDVRCLGAVEPAVHAKVVRALAKQGLQFCEVCDTKAVAVTSRQGELFQHGLRELQSRHPRNALDHFCEVIEIDPQNARARMLATTIQAAYVDAMSADTVDFPSWPLFDPTRLLAWLDHRIGRFLFSPWALLPFAMLIVLAIYSYATTPYPPLHVGVFDVVAAVLIVNVHLFLHELGHGLACYHYGGSVREIGFQLFYYVRPALYCDTSSTYLFTNRRHKLIVQLAGNWVSVVFTSLLFIFLGVVHPELWIYPAAQLLMWFSVFQLGLNLMPLFKADGYYAISDYLGIPNLRERSIKYLKIALGARLLGLDGKQEEATVSRRRLLLGFGAASVVFTVIWIYTGLFVLLAPIVEHFQLLGLVISTVLAWYVLRNTVLRPLARFAKLLVRERRTIFTRRRARLQLAVLALFVLPWMIPWPVMVDGELTIVPGQRLQIRAQVAGTVERVLVHEGDVVTAGQPLAVLASPELAMHISALDADLANIDARLAQLRRGARAEEIAVATQAVHVANATMTKHAARAAMARDVADAGGTSASAAEHAAGDAAVSAQLAHAASWKLAELVAGARPEDIAAAEAERERIVAERDHALADRERLTIRSTIPGIVITSHLEDRRFERLDRGDMLAEVQDTRGFYAEIELSPSAPLHELEQGDEVALRMYGHPDREITARFELVRVPIGGARPDELTAVTTTFSSEVARAGMRGHARVYGRRRTLAYSQLYLPLERLVRVTLWSMM